MQGSVTPETGSAPGRVLDAAGAPHWRLVVLAVSAPLLVLLSLTLWRTPFPLSEGVALLEDVAQNPATRFFSLDTSYYRPLYHLTLSAIWHGAGSIDVALGGIKLLQIIPVLLLVLLFIWHLRPQTSVDAAVALVAVAVLFGSAAFRDNLEIPLSYTTVGMPAALAAWMVLEREHRRGSTAAIVALTLVAIGFKEQGLVIVPVVVAAWWAGAPGVRRSTAMAVVVVAVAYVGLRLTESGSWPLFQQDVGFGFARLSPDEATARFGAFPLWIFIYSAASTVGNVLFAEPTAGVFRIVDSIRHGRPVPAEVAELVSSVALTAIIGWWAVGVVRRAVREGWSADARLVLVTATALAGCAALSVNYSRDRLGGMALVFYGLSAYAALRAVSLRALSLRAASLRAVSLRAVSLQAGALRSAHTSPRRCAVAGALLMVLAGLWEIRAVGTIDYARDTARKNRREWLVGLPQRRGEFADRATYLRLMESLVEQGTDPAAPSPTRYRRWAARVVRGR